MVRWEWLRNDHPEMPFPREQETQYLKKNGEGNSFNPQVSLDTGVAVRKVAVVRRGESIYSQGEAADSLFGGCGVPQHVL